MRNRSGEAIGKMIRTRSAYFFTGLEEQEHLCDVWGKSTIQKNVANSAG